MNVKQVEALNTQGINGRLQSIDALRGLAAILIVFYHARPIFWDGLGQTWQKYGLSLAPNAWLGYLTFPVTWAGFAVHLFFVLSGYCIHRRYAKSLATDRTVKLDVKQFLLRRFWRIYPVYLAGLLLTALVDYFLKLYYPSVVQPNLDNSLPTFLMSLLSMQGLIAPYFGCNTTFWTLALEIHLYLLYPVLFYFSKYWGSLKLLKISFLMSTVYVGLDWVLNFSSALPYERSGHPVLIPFLFTCSFGMYIADLEANRVEKIQNLRFISCFGLGIAVLSSIKGQDHLATLTITPALVDLILWSTSSRGITFWASRFGSVMASIGLFSYSLYAIHRPCLLMIQAVFPALKNYSATIWPSILSTLLCIILGWAFFAIFEKRSLMIITKLRTSS